MIQQLNQRALCRSYVEGDPIELHEASQQIKEHRIATLVTGSKHNLEDQLELLVTLREPSSRF